MFEPLELSDGTPLEVSFSDVYGKSAEEKTEAERVETKDTPSLLPYFLGGVIIGALFKYNS